jgi:hypothetical protein
MKNGFYSSQPMETKNWAAGSTLANVGWPTSENGMGGCRSSSPVMDGIQNGLFFNALKKMRVFYILIAKP